MPTKVTARRSNVQDFILNIQFVLKTKIKNQQYIQFNTKVKEIKLDVKIPLYVAATFITPG